MQNDCRQHLAFSCRHEGSRGPKTSQNNSWKGPSPMLRCGSNSWVGVALNFSAVSWHVLCHLLQHFPEAILLLRLRAPPESCLSGLAPSLGKLPFWSGVGPPCRSSASSLDSWPIQWPRCATTSQYTCGKSLTAVNGLYQNTVPEIRDIHRDDRCQRLDISWHYLGLRHTRRTRKRG